MSVSNEDISLTYPKICGKLTNANNKLKAIENLGGCSGSHLHPGGVQDTTAQHRRKKPLFLILANLVSDAVLDIEAELFASTSVLVSPF